MANVMALDQLGGSRNEKQLNMNGLNGRNQGLSFEGAGVSSAASFMPSYGVDLGSSRFDTDEDNSAVSLQQAAIQHTAGNIDVSTFRNYDVVMAHTLSEEDYAKARENGFDMKGMEPGETVTILDKIKAVMAKAGQTVAGFNDDLDVDTLTEITGSRSYAGEIVSSFKENDIPLSEENVAETMKAVDMGMELDPLSKGAANYLIKNNLEPSVDNIYLAEHATNGRNGGHGTWYMQDGYLTRKADTNDYSEIEAQVEEVIESTGLLDEGAENGRNLRQMAVELLDDGLPLTVNNLEQKYRLDTLSLPPERKTIVAAAASGIADGRKATEGNLAEPISKVNKAVQDIDDLNRNITLIEDDAAFDRKEEYSSVKQLLDMEDTRFAMTAEAGIRLYRSGVEIDTSYVRDSVEKLQSAVTEMANALFGKSEGTMSAEDKFTLYQQTQERAVGIMHSPAAIVGALKDEFRVVTLEDIFQKGTQLKATYDKAMTTYEEVGTSPRADLGDSIRKAFRNIDDILTGMDMDTNDANRRAVRILGYNHAALTKENIEQVRSWDSKLMSTIDRLKPSSVLQMIRDGENPLRMTLDELGASLDKRDDNSDSRQEKFARFLYKMEKNGQLTEAEKESCIGVYRLFENLKKTDYAAIGTVLQTHGEMTIGNLLAANRTLNRSARTMDYRVDDTFGGLERGENRTIDIDVQIETAFRYYSGRAESAYQNMEPEKVIGFNQTVQQEGQTLEGSTLEAFAEAMENMPEDRATSKSYDKRQTEDTREVLEDAIVRGDVAELENAGIPVTIRTLEAMHGIRAGRSRRSQGRLWDELRMKIGSEEQNAFGTSDSRTADPEADNNETQADNIVNKLQDIRHYQENVTRLSEEIDSLTDEADTYLDISAMRLMHKELSVTADMSGGGRYEIPVMTADGLVSMQVTLVSAQGETGHMQATIDGGDYGTLRADIDENGSGLISTSAAATPQVRHFMEELQWKFAALTKEDTDSIGIMYSVRTEAQNKQSQGGNVVSGGKAPGTDELINLAQHFINAVTDMMEQFA